MCMRIYADQLMYPMRLIYEIRKSEVEIVCVPYHIKAIPVTVSLQFHHQCNVSDSVNDGFSDGFSDSGSVGDSQRQ